MGKALEQQFDCEIKSTNYEFKDWNHTLVFELEDHSKNRVTEEQAKEYLAATFSEFWFVNEFEVR